MNYNAQKGLRKLSKSLTSQLTYGYEHTHQTVMEAIEKVMSL